MGRRRKGSQYRPQKKNYNLDNIDTTGTLEPDSRSRQAKHSVAGHVESASPVFHDETLGSGSDSITRAEFSAGFKVVMFFLTAIPLACAGAWYLSSLDSKVTVLTSDMGDVKDAAKDLGIKSIEHSGRLDSIRTDISDIKEIIKEGR